MIIRVMRLRALLLVAPLAACSERVSAPRDATANVDVMRADVALDASADASDTDVDTVSVRTCSELRLGAITAAPGGLLAAYPGSRLALTGDDLAVIDRVSVGGVEVTFEREGDAVITHVPPMLAPGEQTVVVANERCSASRAITVSRLLAQIPREGGRVTLLDWARLDAAGALDTGLSSIVQGQFTVDGRALVLRDRDGRVAVSWLAPMRTTTLTLRARGPFALAWGTVVPTQALLAVPTGMPSGLLRVDTDATAVTPYEGPANDPIGVATTLDGFRALVLDQGGVGYALDRPFARTPAWSRFGDFTTVRSPAEIVLEQGAAVTIHGPLAAVYDATDPPAVLPMDSLTGTLGERLEVPGAAGGMYFLSGDVVAMDATTPEVITADITALTGIVSREPLEGESPTGVVRTHTAATLYRVGAVALRMSASGVPEGDSLHVFDFHREPAVEERRVMIAGLRGVAGIQGAGDPFAVWTARAVMRVRGTDGERVVERAVPAAEGEVGFVVVPR
ncbi:MAG: hypothetical protein U0326_40145 [Polyangiales bacterium]